MTLKRTPLELARIAEFPEAIPAVATSSRIGAVSAASGTARSTSAAPWFTIAATNGPSPGPAARAAQEPR